MITFVYFISTSNLTATFQTLVPIFTALQLTLLYSLIFYMPFIGLSGFSSFAVAGLILLGLVIRWKSGLSYFLPLVLIPFIVRKIYYKRVIRVGANAVLSSTFFVFLLYFINLLPHVLTIKGSGAGTKYVYAFGFSNANMPAQYLVLVALSLFVVLEKWRFRDYAIIFAILLFTFVVLQSRTASFTIIALLLTKLPIFDRIVKKIATRRGRFFCYIVVIATILFSISMMVNYQGTPFENQLNDLLSGRLYQLHGFYQYYGLSIFGQPITYNSNINNLFWYLYNYSTLVLDNAIGRMIINNGIIYFITYYSIIFYGFHKVKKTEFIIALLFIVVSNVNSSIYIVGQTSFILAAVFSEENLPKLNTELFSIFSETKEGKNG
ncbi:hypothetical protein N42HA_02902 [Lactococcus lactis]|nr:hypothetical protein [Lactococcus lactis]